MTRVDRFVILIACEKLEIEEAAEYEIVREQARFVYRVAIPGHPVVEVTDEEIRRREPSR